MKLDELVTSGDLVSYKLENFNEEGQLIDHQGEGMRETQRLILEFPSGNTLVIDTFCSGSAENTYLDMKVLGRNG